MEINILAISMAAIRWNTVICAEHLAQCIAYCKSSINIVVITITITQKVHIIEF